MCLSVGLSKRDFAIIATDRSVFSLVPGPDGGPSSTRELDGGKLRSGVGGWMTVAGGSHCWDLLDGWDSSLPLADEAQVGDWLKLMNRANPTPRELPSWLTTVFHDGREFHLRAYSEDGEVAHESYTTGEALLIIFPKGIEDVELRQRLRQSFLEALDRAFSRGLVELVADAVMQLFELTREETPYLGPTTDVVVMYTDREAGPTSRRFTNALREATP